MNENVAIETLLALRDKLRGERSILLRRIEGLEMALDALGHKVESKDVKEAKAPAKPRTRRRNATIAQTGHPLKYLIKEAMYGTPAGMNVRDLGTYLARRGVDPVISDNVSTALSALKVSGVLERGEEGIWRITQTGREAMDNTRRVPA